MISLTRNFSPGVRRPRLRHAEYRDDGSIGFAADRSESDELIPQGETSVLTHLVTVALVVRDVVVEGPDLSLRGIIGLPDMERLRIPFHSHGPMDDTPKRVLVKVQYLLEGVVMDFGAWLSRERGGWFFSLPRAIRTRGRRLNPRYRVHGGWAFEVADGGDLKGARLPVVDASAGGLGLRLTEGWDPSLEGRVFRGRLMDVTGMSIRAQIEIVGVRLRDEQPGRVVGCVFKGIGLDNHVRVAQALQSQHDRRAVPDGDADVSTPAPEDSPA